MESENNVLIVLANKDFRDEEFNTPETVFRENGIGIKVAAGEPDDCVGVGGTTIAPDYTFDQINPDQFDAIVYVGGIGVERYFANELAINLAKEFAKAGKLVAAICWATVILAKAGLVAGKKVTGSSNAKPDLIAVGANYTGALVETDGNIITGSGPDAAGSFANKIAAAINRQD
jgi:protease I